MARKYGKFSIRLLKNGWTITPKTAETRIMNSYWDKEAMSCCSTVEEIPAILIKLGKEEWPDQDC